AGPAGAALEPEAVDLLRRVPAAVHGHEPPRPRRAGDAARRHLHGDRGTDRRDLRTARRPRTKTVFGAADAAGVAHFRRLHDRRRHLARTDAGALNLRLTKHLGFDLAENPREPLGKSLLAALVGDQILPDLDAGIDEAARLAMHGNGVVGGV